MSRVLLIALLMPAFAHADVTKNLVTGKEAVSYRIGDAWALVSLQDQQPVSSAVYQIPNPADADTPESTNIVLMLYDLSTDKGRRGYEAPLPQYSGDEPLESAIGGWSVVKHTCRQNEVEYTILDARNDNVADLAATVRLAWPHLPANAPDYDQQMEKTLRGFLAGIDGQFAPRSPEGKVD